MIIIEKSTQIGNSKGTRDEADCFEIYIYYSGWHNQPDWKPFWRNFILDNNFFTGKI